MLNRGNRPQSHTVVNVLGRLLILSKKRFSQNLNDTASKQVSGPSLCYSRQLKTMMPVLMGIQLSGSLCYDKGEETAGQHVNCTTAHTHSPSLHKSCFMWTLLARKVLCLAS